MRNTLLEVGISEKDADALLSVASAPEALANPVGFVSNLVDEYASRIGVINAKLIGYNKFIALAGVIFVGEHRNIKDAVIPQYFETYVDHLSQRTDYSKEQLDKAIWAGVDIMQKAGDDDTVPVVWAKL